MEKNTESAHEQPSPSDVQEDTDKALSLRDALEVAIEATEHDTGRAETDRAADRAASGDARPKSDAGGNQPSVPASEEEPPLQPPAEWNNEEKADFAASSRKQQEAALRLHRSRMSRLEEIKTAARDFEHVKRLADDIEPFVRALGVKEKPAVAIQKAVALWKQFEEGDPKAAAAAYLRAKGLNVPRELIENQQADPLEEKLKPLQEELSSVKMKLAQEEHTKAAEALRQVWTSFEQAKNAAGGHRFPDILPDKGEAGLRLSSQIGSLVGGHTPLSQQFIASVRARNPEATFETLLTEAYRFYGGRVDDSEAPKSQSPQQHLYKSNRAASSVPGRGAPASNGGVRRFKTYREALEAAKAELDS